MASIALLALFRRGPLELYLGTADGSSTLGKGEGKEKRKRGTAYARSPNGAGSQYPDGM